MDKGKSIILKFYVFAICLSGLFILFYILLKYRNISVLGVVLFGLLVFIADNLSAPLPKAGSVSVNFGLLLASLVIFGPSTAIITTTVIILNIKEYIKKAPYYKHLFNGGQYLISMGVVCIVFEFLYERGAINYFYPKNIGVIFLSAFIFFALNTTLTAGAISISEKINFINIWIYNFAWLIPSQIFLAVMAMAISFLYKWQGPFTLIFTTVPLIVAQYTYILRIKERNALISSIRQIVKVMEAKDVYTAGHSVRVAEYSEKIARELRLSEYDIEILKQLAHLHDLGKIQVDLSVLNKPQKFVESDWEEMKKHPVVGYEIVKEITFLENYASAILYHHERIDGTGYPYGKKGNEIPLFARILCIADAYDAMTTSRPYKKRALVGEESIRELEKNAGKQFDSKICKVFIEFLKREWIKK